MSLFCALPVEEGDKHSAEMDKKDRHCALDREKMIKKWQNFKNDLSKSRDCAPR